MTINRPAVAMVELIFAIVIMGIALMSAPSLMTTASKSGYVGIQQEGINEAAAHLRMVLSYHWDERDVEEGYIDPILTVSAPDHDNELDSQGAPTNRRAGTPIQSWRSFIREDGTNNLVASDTSTFGSSSDSNETSISDADDMDDFDQDIANLELIGDESNADYVDQVQIATNVVYYPDKAKYTNVKYLSFNFNPTKDVNASDGNTYNIKRIKVTLTSISGVSELNKTIVLNAFACNIGGTKPLYKVFP